MGSILSSEMFKDIALWSFLVGGYLLGAILYDRYLEPAAALPPLVYYEAPNNFPGTIGTSTVAYYSAPNNPPST